MSATQASDESNIASGLYMYHLHSTSQLVYHCFLPFFFFPLGCVTSSSGSGILSFESSSLPSVGTVFADGGEEVSALRSSKSTSCVGVTAGIVFCCCCDELVVPADKEASYSSKRSGSSFGCARLSASLDLPASLRLCFHVSVTSARSLSDD